MHKERKSCCICSYKVEILPLSIVNIDYFEVVLNKLASEGWELKHTFATTGLKLVTIWEKIINA